MRALAGRVMRLLRGAIDVAFPQTCLLCRLPFSPVAGNDDPPAAECGAAASAAISESSVRPAEWLCSTCLDGLNRERHATCCPRCAGDVGPYEVADGRCRQCRHRRPHVIAAVRAGRYGDAFQQAVHAYKYEHRDDLEELLIAWMIGSVRSAPWLSRAEVVVPVPTHWRHSIGRRRYVPDRLARGVAVGVGLPYERLLVRTRGGPHQLGLPASQRAINIRGAFALTPGYRIDGARVLLVDDVKTTGATLEECGKTLRQAGVSEVYACVLTRVNLEPRRPSRPPVRKAARPRPDEPVSGCDG